MSADELHELERLLEGALEDEHLAARPVPGRPGKRAGADLVRALVAVRDRLAEL